MNRSSLGFVLVLAVLLAAAPAHAQDGRPALPFVPTLFGDGRTSLPDGIPSSRGAEKIGENDSPWPSDRVYFNWNYYHHVHAFWDHIHRQTLGIEKTFLDGRASLGARLPFFQHPPGDGHRADLRGHVNTPLTYRGDFVDSVVLIAGVNVVFNDRATLGLAIGPNVSRPKLFDFETQVTFNWRW